MKNYIYIILFAFALSSCEDLIVVEPDGIGTIEERLETAQDAREFMNSAYNAMTSGGAWGGQYALISELMADGTQNFDFTGDWQAHYNRTTSIFNSTSRGMVTDGYRAIARANNVMDNMRLATDLSDTDAATLEGEGKFIRAMGHFDLVRFFGQPYGYTADNSHLGIPVRTSFGPDRVDRSTVGQVYAQIIQDLMDAVNLLPANNGAYANSWSAKALLAKVYFQMNDFENAFSYANDVMENSPYSFDDDFRAKYGYGETTEVLFGLVSTDIDLDNANGGLRGYFFPDPSTGLVSVPTSTSYAQLFALEEDDQRDDAWLQQLDGRYACAKFNIDSAYNNPVLHLTEIKLIRAESAAELSMNSVAVTDLNDIRERAGMVALSENLAGEPLFQQLRIERRKELYFENNRLHELKRIALRDTPGLTIREANWDCPGMVCQIPDVELQGFPGMEINPQGGCN